MSLVRQLLPSNAATAMMKTQVLINWFTQLHLRAECNLSLEGVDADKFSIDENTGAVTLQAAQTLKPKVSIALL